MKPRALAGMAFIAILLGLYLVLNKSPEAVSPSAPTPPMWSFDPETLTGMAIELPLEGKGQTWVKADDRNWHFDSAGGPAVDSRRWGGGIPLLLSGPNAERLIVSDANMERLVAFGLDRPAMTVTLTLEGGETIRFDIGTTTPDGRASYIRVGETKSVYSVHHTFRDVLERLVRDPPYSASGGS